jgi:starvation-inducible DNA-binding protein
MGRVMAARMDKEADGSSFVRLQIAITDPVAIQKVLDKRYLTGSVGGRAGKAVCSISGEDLARETQGGRPSAAKYKRGQVYKGKLAFIDMQDISFKEYSFVNQPADQKSSIRSINPSDGTPVQDSEDGWVAKSSAFVLHMDKEDIVSVEENESILESMKKKESKPLYLHLKGAFLTALSIHESEDYNNNNNSLLSNENKDSNSYEENSNMKKNVKSEDILAAVEDLSNDLSAIASGSVVEAQEDAEAETAPETEEVVEETPADEAPDAEESIKTEEAASGTSAAVQKVLNEMIVLGFVAQRAHWNVTGTDFEEYHALFGAIYEDIFDSVDSVAEEIRKMNVMVENLTNMVMSSSFKDDATVSDPRTLTQDLLSKNMMLNESILAAFNLCSESNEQGTADLLASRDGMHKKWSWQLRSSLGEEAGEPADESWRVINSTVVSESAEELAPEAVESANPEVAEENKVDGDSEAELTDNNAVSEQDADDSMKKLQLLEEENQKLKSALHRTLVERVVDAKIAAGVESHEVREELIEEHTSRSASSLADSLRDLAKMPIAKNARNNMLEMDSEIAVIEGEDNVITVDKNNEEEVKEKVTNAPEQLFVDALMGRRKL